MKKMTLRITIFLFVLYMPILYAFVKKEKCDPDALYEEAMKKLANFSLLKDYRVTMKEKKKTGPVEILYTPITLNRGVKYKFVNLQSVASEGKLVMSLYTSSNNKPDFMFATNYEKSINKFYESIEFKSESTMNCFIALSFLDGKEGCGICVSSFLKN